MVHYHKGISTLTHTRVHIYIYTCLCTCVHECLSCRSSKIGATRRRTCPIHNERLRRAADWRSDLLTKKKRSPSHLKTGCRMEVSHEVTHTRHRRLERSITSRRSSLVLSFDETLAWWMFGSSGFRGGIRDRFATRKWTWSPVSFSLSFYLPLLLSLGCTDVFFSPLREIKDFFFMFPWNKFQTLFFSLSLSFKSVSFFWIRDSFSLFSFSALSWHNIPVLHRHNTANFSFLIREGNWHKRPEEYDFLTSQSWLKEDSVRVREKDLRKRRDSCAHVCL